MLTHTHSAYVEINESETDLPALPRGLQWGQPLSLAIVRSLRAAPETDVRHATRDRLQGYQDGLKEAHALVFRARQGRLKNRALNELLSSVEGLKRSVAEQLELLRNAEHAPRPVPGARPLPTQDATYSIRFNRLVTTQGGEPIPRSEPILILRASTPFAARAALFEQFALDHPYAKLNEPDAA